MPFRAFTLSVCLATFAGAASSTTTAFDRASPPAQLWAKGYTFGNAESHPHAGVETADGGFFLVGDGVNYSNNTVVRRHIFALKTDSEGVLLWQVSIGECGWNYGKFGAELDDGSFVIAGAISSCEKYSPDTGLGNTLHRALVRISASGEVLHTQLLPNARASEGRRDGFMCITLSATEKNTVLLTGFVNGESASEGYVDEAMFLIAGGTAHLTKLTYASAATDWTVVFDVPLIDAAQNPKDFEAWQGMRVLHDAKRGQYIVSSTAVPKADPDQRRQFSLFATTESGEPRWGKIYTASNGVKGGHASHPYALTALDDVGQDAAYAIGGLAVLYNDQGIEQCEGRVVGMAAVDGALVFDDRFAESDTKDENTECYGIAPGPDGNGGYVVTCGAGVEPELHPHDSQRAKTWRVFAHAGNATGSPVWSTTYTSNEQLQNNAGENILRTRSGNLVVLVDSQTYGSGSTGGNFALIKLAKEQGIRQFDDGATVQ